MQRNILPVLFALLSNALFAQVVFTSSGTFVVPPGVDTITVELVGAGGNGGGGGGGGGYARRTSAVTPGTSYSIVVGTGGSGLATIIGGMGVLANAGEDGTSVSNPNVGGGGAGGTAMGGQTNRTGGAGGGGYWTYFGGGGGGAAGAMANGGVGGNTIVYNGNCLTPGGSAGVGGGAPGGNGGKGGGFTDIGCTVSDLNTDGAAYGGGGGGGNGIGSPVGVGGGGGGAAGAMANGGVGGNTIVYNGNCLTPGGSAGVGGGAPGGNGGKGAGFTDANCTVSDPVGNGIAYGGGGGGGNGIGSPVGVGGGGICIITWNGASAIDEPMVGIAPTLLCNPFTDRIALRHARGDEQFELLDATGRMIYSGEHIEVQDLSRLKAGAYVLRVRVPAGVRTLKAIKEIER